MFERAQGAPQRRALKHFLETNDGRRRDVVGTFNVGVARRPLEQEQDVLGGCPRMTQVAPGRMAGLLTRLGDPKELVD